MSLDDDVRALSERISADVERMLLEPPHEVPDTNGNNPLGRAWREVVEKANVRALLLAFLEYLSDPVHMDAPKRSVDAFLANPFTPGYPQCPSRPMVYGPCSDPQCKSCRSLEITPSAPHVKVTEAVGVLRDAGTYEECGFCHLDMSEPLGGSDGRQYPYMGLEDFCPDEACPDGASYHNDVRGRFRITCEFWPDHK
jgi:hypothetical protein